MDLMIITYLTYKIPLISYFIYPKYKYKVKLTYLKKEDKTNIFSYVVLSELYIFYYCQIYIYINIFSFWDVTLNLYIYL